MSEISKQALSVENTTNFPNNNTGYITPALLRSFNTDMIDSTVNQIVYTADSSSWNSKISQLNAFTASQQPTFTALNAFTASQLSVNSGVNSFTQSADGRLDLLENDTANLEAFTSSINQIIVNGVSIGTSTRFFFNGYASASIVPNVDGDIASITILADQTFTPSASFNAYTASTNAWTASAKTSISSLNTNSASVNTSISSLNSFTASQIDTNASVSASLGQLLNLSASLSGGYATQGELDQSSSILQANIDTKLNTSSFNAYTQSNNNVIAGLSTTSSFNAYTASTNVRLNNLETFTGSYATTGSNLFIGNQTVVGTTTITGSLLITGSVRITGSAKGNVISASIVSSTASIDLSTGDFFTLTLSGSTTTNINITNPQPGTTALLRITNTGIPSASFSSNVLQPKFNSYLPSSGSTVDILQIASFDTNTVYLTKANNFV